MSAKMIYQCDNKKYHYTADARYGEISTQNPEADGWFRVWKGGAPSLTIQRCAVDDDGPGEFHFCSWDCFSEWAESQLDKAQPVLTVEVSHDEAPA